MGNHSFSQMRLRNAEAILQAVRSSTEISRADLARLTALSPATVSSIVDQLIVANFLFESGARSSSMGRRPIGLVFNPSSVYSAGISIEGKSLQLVLTDLNGEQKTEPFAGVTGKLDACDITEGSIKLLRSACKSAGISVQMVATLGIAAPGPLKDDVLINSHQPEIPRAVAQALERKLGIPVTLKSMVNMAALAEALHGVGRTAKLLVYFRIGHAMRSAVLLERNLLEGKNNLAGEVGHLVIPHQEWVCFCGKLGCINGIVSIPSFLDHCQKLGFNIESIDDLTSLLNEPAFVALLAKCACAMAYGVASTIDLLAPDAVIVSAPYFCCGDAFKAPFAEALSKYTQSDLLTQCKIVQNQLKGSTEAFGASLWAMENIPLLDLIKSRFEAD